MEKTIEQRNKELAYSDHFRHQDLVTVDNKRGIMIVDVAAMDQSRPVLEGYLRMMFNEGSEEWPGYIWIHAKVSAVTCKLVFRAGDFFKKNRIKHMVVAFSNTCVHVCKPDEKNGPYFKMEYPEFFKIIDV